MYIENKIDDMLQQMFQIKTFYYEQVHKTRRQRRQKLLQSVSPIKQQSKSVQSPHITSTNTKKLNQPNFFSTFVNIKDARYQLGPAQSYNFKKIQFPDIGKKKEKTAQNKIFKQTSEDFDVVSGSFEFTSSSFKLLKKSNVKQSWNRNKYILNLNYPINEPQSRAKFTRKIYHANKKAKDRTEQNIEGWSSVYNQDDQINVASRS